MNNSHNKQDITERKNRGEKLFRKFPSFAAKMYNKLMNSTPIKTQFQEIAKDLIKKQTKGTLLDVGTGPGNLLLEINKLNPKIDLSGIDISESMLRVAQNKLSELKVDLRVGNIQSTNYDSEFFDLVTCSGSFYLWNNPVQCLAEIKRILRKNGIAVFYETYRDYNKEEFKIAIKKNLKKVSPINRPFLKFFLKRQLKMTYDMQELEEIMKSSVFKNTYQLSQIRISNLPIWVRIELRNNSF